MLPLPADLQARFEKMLPVNGVPEKAREFYLRWLRFYLDYCRKYDIPLDQPESQPLFLQKLQEKKLPPWQQEQVSHAVALYFELIPAATESIPAPAPIVPYRRSLFSIFPAFLSSPRKTWSAVCLPDDGLFRLDERSSEG